MSHGVSETSAVIVMGSNDSIIITREPLTLSTLVDLREFAKFVRSPVPIIVVSEMGLNYIRCLILIEIRIADETSHSDKLNISLC